MGVGTGLIGTGIVSAGAFDQFTGDRGVDTAVASDSLAVVGLDVADQVEKNQRQKLVDVTNNYTESISVDVTLDDPTQGTLYNASFTLSPGTTGTVDIESAVKDQTIPFTVSVSGGVGLTAQRSTQAVANSTGPTADAGGPYTVATGGTTELDGTNSTGKQLSYSWTITSGPGSLQDASTATPVFDASNVSSADRSTVELTVTDNKGNTDTDTSTVDITDSSSPPTADFTYTRQNKNFVDLDGSASSDEGTIQSYEWDVGADGTVDHTGQTVTKVRASSGTQIKLTVTDNDGETDSITKTV